MGRGMRSCVQAALRVQQCHAAILQATRTWIAIGDACGNVIHCAPRSQVDTIGGLPAASSRMLVA